MPKNYVKVPVVMQMEALECGAASLAMTMAYYGKWVALSQVRVDCGVSRDGSNAKNILRAARNYGFECKGYRYEPEYLRENGKFPCPGKVRAHENIERTNRINSGLSGNQHGCRTADLPIPSLHTPSHIGSSECFASQYSVCLKRLKCTSDGRRAEVSDGSAASSAS